MVADGVVSEMSYTLSKHVRWQVLLADLLQYNMNETVSENSSLQELIKKTKTCITSVRIGTGRELKYTCILIETKARS